MRRVRICELRNLEALILNIGTELTLGVTVNTNGSWLARRLTYLGFHVKKIVVVRDDEGDVVEELQRGLKLYGLIVTTGGLGPTYDDRTSSFVAKSLGVGLELNGPALEMVRESHRQRGEDVNEVRVKQAYLPQGAIPLRNAVGTAPGFLICAPGGSLIISLPGPPRELQPMFENEVEPLLRGLSGLKYVEDLIEIKGVTESKIARMVERFAKENPQLYVKTHPKVDEGGESVIQIQISAYTKDVSEGKELLDKVKESLVREINEELRKGNAS